MQIKFSNTELFFCKIHSTVHTQSHSWKNETFNIHISIKTTKYLKNDPHEIKQQHDRNKQSDIIAIIRWPIELTFNALK